MIHYICTDTCKGVSGKPGKCQAENCPKFGQPLETCDCVDQKHYDKQTHDKEGNSGVIGESDDSK